MQTRKLVAEFVGTFFLVFFAVGVATLSFGFKFFGTSTSAGVVATALCFGLVLLAPGLHPGAHLRLPHQPGRDHGLPGLGADGARRRRWSSGSPSSWGASPAPWSCGASSPPHRSTPATAQGLGADGFGPLSMIRINAVGAFFTEVILTLLFVYIVLAATSKLMASPALAGLAIGLGLTVVHLIGIPITGTSVNPARSLGPALIVGGQALSQVWLFIVAPLVGGAIAALLYRYFGAAARRGRGRAGGPSRPVITAAVAWAGMTSVSPADLSVGSFSNTPPWLVDPDDLPWRAGVAALRAATAAQVPDLLRRRRLPPGRRVLRVAAELAGPSAPGT